MCDDKCADYIRRAVRAAKARLDALPTLDEPALLEACASFRMLSHPGYKKQLLRTGCEEMLVAARG
jgi:hypothetical protein